LQQVAKGGQWLQLFGLDRLGEGEPLDHHGLAARRLVFSMAVGAGALAVALSVGAASSTSVTLGWDFAAILFLVSVGCSVWGKNPAASARIAQAEDSSRVAADAALLSASVSSLVAVGFVLVNAGHSSSGSKGLLIGLTIASVVLAWATVHTVYMLRYARLFYAAPIGGIDFHDGELPDYHDLAYVALTIGMTFQVSDTDLVSKAIRRAAIRHALLSYLFGAVIVAITINIVASLLSK
jgi:uncharacterized membrane protein